MKISFLFIGLCFMSSAMAQSLKDSLFGGKLKSDTGKTFVSKDTSKYVAPLKNETISAPTGDKKKNEVNKVEINKPDESMPDSLNKLYYAKQKTWKRFIESNIPIITQAASDSKKVRKGEYTVEVEYEIGLNGRITTKNVTCSPQNEFLVSQVTDLMKRAPVLAPPITAMGNQEHSLQHNLSRLQKSKFKGI